MARMPGDVVKPGWMAGPVACDCRSEFHDSTRRTPVRARDVACFAMSSALWRLGIDRAVCFSKRDSCAWAWAWA